MIDGYRAIELVELLPQIQEALRNAVSERGLLIKSIEALEKAKASALYRLDYEAAEYYQDLILEIEEGKE